MLVAVGTALTFYRSREPLDVTFWLQRPAALVMGAIVVGGLAFINTWDIVTMAFVVVVAGNVVQAFTSTGPPPFMGQSDPVRFSFNPRHWLWSANEWKPPLKYAFRGRWAVRFRLTANRSSSLSDAQGPSP